MNLSRGLSTRGIFRAIGTSIQGQNQIPFVSRTEKFAIIRNSPGGALTISNLVCAAVVAALLAMSATPALAQFSANIQGVVQDSTGAAVPGADLTLRNTSTQITVNATSNSAGDYRFLSIAPGSYQITVRAHGFAETARPLTLQTNQNYNLPIKLAVGSVSQSVNVTTQGPVLDTADSRNQMTLTTQTLSSLPLAGRNMVTLITMAPGVVGLGTTASGSPGSGVDNYSPETQISASANGQGSVANMYIVDGLDVTSVTRDGVLNLTPNPDGIQETSIQTNTYTVEYGRASSIQMTMTTKSGTDAYHGNLSDYFNDQYLFARTEFTPLTGYAPFHSNNFSGSIGGPLIPHHKAFFFFDIEPLRASTSTGNSIVTFEAPQFTAYAQSNYPNTLGTQLMTKYVPDATNISTVKTAAQLFPGTCGTAATNDLPCSLPMVAQGVYNSSSFRNGDQWNLRLDKYFTNDKLYGNFYRTTLNASSPSVRPAFSNVSKYNEWALQINETHTFSPTKLNEAIFSASKVQGIIPATGTFDVPIINIPAISAGFGTNFALGDYWQNDFRWRDVLTTALGNHFIKLGATASFATNVGDFAGPHDQPHIQFNNLLELAEDNPYTESYVAYDPLTGKHVEWNSNAAGYTWGLFLQDTWKMRRNLTLTYGLRWDDFGNPYSRSAETVFGNFYYGPGQTTQQQIANGFVVPSKHVFRRALTDIFSPRVGIAWDPTGTGVWLFHGGAGIYHNWPSLGNTTEMFRGSPPGPIFPTFYRGTANSPLLSVGNSEAPPFGFTYPSLPAQQLTPQGGLVGLQFPIGGIDPELKSPAAYIWSVTVSKALVKNVVASIGYSGSKDVNLLSGGGQQSATVYGQDINSLPGDLILHNSLVPQRLNQSFGSISYTANDRVSTYNALILDVKGRIGENGTFGISYTRSSSMDDTQNYPTYTDPHQYYAPSVWNVPNDFQLHWSYRFPSLKGGDGFTGRIASGWVLSGDTSLESGTPFTVYTNAPFLPTVNGAGTFIGYQPGSGDYNGDGDDLDYPNVTNYHISTNRKSYLNGLFQGGASGQYANGYTNFPLPAFGQEGNEKYGQFQSPGFAQVDAALLKNTHISKNTDLELRLDMFNVLNRVNLNGVVTNLASGTFGKSVAQLNPRWMQIGANIKF